jgi:hypothetical protein
MHQDPQRCATLNEYAAATGIDVSALLRILAEGLQRGDIQVEAVGGEIFLHTAPRGRPTPPENAQVAPNLWELLRRGHSAEEAYALWRITRDMQAAGWSVEADARGIPAAGGETALLGLRFAQSVVPVMILPPLEYLASQAGALTRYEVSGMGLCAVACKHRDLEPASTAVRRWMLGRPARAGLDVLILEAPRYQPILLTSDDGGIEPRSVTIDYLSGR